MLEEKKYCQMCGVLISDLSDDRTDYYSHLAKKYCPVCRETSDHLKVAARMQRFRQRKRQLNKERETQLDLLRQENELLRQKIAVLRDNGV